MTFRLADSVVVDPSSSYEETPSPSEDHDERRLDDAEVDSALDIPAIPLQHYRGNRTRSGWSPYKSNQERQKRKQISFSFDEELDNVEERRTDDQDVCNPDTIVVSSIHG